MSKTLRNVFGIIAWVVSGFFLYILDNLAFVNLPDVPVWPVKFIVLAVFAVPAIVLMVIAGFCRGFDHFRRDLGIVLLSSAAMNGLLIVSLVCMFASPDLARSLPPDGLRMFSAVVPGIACLSLYVFLGLGLLLTPRRAGRSESNPG